MYIPNLIVWISSDQKSAATLTAIRSGGSAHLQSFLKDEEEDACSCPPNFQRPHAPPPHMWLLLELSSTQ